MLLAGNFGGVVVNTKMSSPLAEIIYDASQDTLNKKGRVDNTMGRHRIEHKKDRVLIFNSDLLPQIYQEHPFLFVAGVTSSGKNSVMDKIGLVNSIPLYHPPKFTQNPRASEVNRVPLVGQVKEDQVGLTYISYGTIVTFLNNMFDGTADKIANLHTSSPGVTGELLTHFAGLDNLVSFLFDVPTSHITARVMESGDKSKISRQGLVRKYIEEFRRMKDRFLIVLKNPGYSISGPSQREHTIKSASARVETTVKYWLDYWSQHWNALKAAEGAMPFETKKREFHRYFVNTILEGLYGTSDLDELRRIIREIKDYAPSVNSGAVGAGKKHAFGNLTKRNELDALLSTSQSGLDYRTVEDALRNISPTEINEEGGKVIIGHDKLRGGAANAPYEQALRSLFTEVVLKYAGGLYPAWYVRSHINGQLELRLTDDTLQSRHAVQFKLE